MSTSVDTVLWEDFTIANDVNGWRAGEWTKTELSASSFSVSGGRGVITCTTPGSSGTSSPLKTAIAWKDAALRYFDATFSSESQDASGASTPAAQRPVALFHWNGILGSGAAGYAIMPGSYSGGKSLTAFSLYRLGSDGTVGTALGASASISTASNNGVVNYRVRVIPGFGTNIIQWKVWVSGNEPTGTWITTSDSTHSGGRIAAGYGTVLGDPVNGRVYFDKIRVTRFSSTADVPTVTAPVSGATTTALATYTTATYTAPSPAAYKNYILFTLISHGTNVPSVTPTGLGLTWTEIGSAGGTVWASTGRRLQAFRASGFATTGTISLATGNANNTGAAWILHEITDGATATTVLESTTASRSAETTFTITPTTTALGFFDTSPYVLTLGAVACAATANTVAPVGLQTELAEVNYLTPTMSLQSSYASIVFTPDGSWGASWTTSSVNAYFIVRIAPKILQAQDQTVAGLSFGAG